MVDGVGKVLDGEIVSPQRSHEEWLRYKEEHGWKYGPVKDIEKKEHPCIMPHEDLPAEQQAKDWVFFGIIRALHFITGSD